VTLNDADALVAILDSSHAAHIADASIVATAAALTLRHVFTLDSHFYAYRLADGSAFEVIA
jgi:predicted nucleic acid-binding protein